MRVWTDLENLPDVLFFSPILRELERAGHTTLLTDRRELGLAELCRRKGLSVERTVGRHHGRSRIVKVVAGLSRAAGLVRAVRAHRPDVLLNFASRPAILAAAALRIPVLTFFDYEHVAVPLVGRVSDRICLPAAIPGDVLPRLGFDPAKVFRLPANKEDVYAHDFTPSSLRAGLGIPEAATFVLIRPPASTAHYHDPRSGPIYDAVLDRIDADASVHTRVLVRNPADGATLRARFPDHARIRELQPTVDGLNLIWNADLVVSGGGTMTREAACLGVPAFSIFTGRPAAVDQALFREGRVTPVTDLTGVRDIPFHPASGTRAVPAPRLDLIGLFVAELERLAG